MSLGLILSRVTPSDAGQTLSGEYGMPFNPTARSVSSGALETQVSIFDFGEGDSRFFGAHAAKRLNKNWELSGGLGHLREAGEFYDGDKTGLSLGAKYLINPDADYEKMRYAAGVGYDGALLDNVRAYVVASKPLRVDEGRAPIWAHFGMRYDYFDGDDFIASADTRSARFSLFTGIEVPLSRRGDFHIVGELQTKHSDFDGARFPYSLGLRYHPRGSEFSISAGWQRQGLFGESGFYAQLGYAFG